MGVVDRGGLRLQVLRALDGLPANDDPISDSVAEGVYRLTAETIRTVSTLVRAQPRPAVLWNHELDVAQFLGRTILLADHVFYPDRVFERLLREPSNLDLKRAAAEQLKYESLLAAGTAIPVPPGVALAAQGKVALEMTAEDLEVFLQLLPRSSTGERMNPYTSLWAGVTPGDGPQECHLVLLDNGRTAVLADEVGREALHCIRCSACLNVCPVYERTGGHAYGSVYPGPIGAILNPLLRGVGSSAWVDSLPYASSLCGACYEVCPVKIDIPSILIHLRGRVVREEKSPREQRPITVVVNVTAADASSFRASQGQIAADMARGGAELGLHSDLIWGADLPSLQAIPNPGGLCERW